MNDLAKVDFSNGPMVYVGEEISYLRLSLIGRESMRRLSWIKR